MNATETVSAVVASAYGGPEVLTLVDVPLAAPGPGEVVLDVRAAGVNPIDAKLYSGNRGADPAALPMRLGFEASGVISAVGEAAAGSLAIGDEVIGYRIDGAYAQRVVVPAEALVPKPASLSFEDAGGLLLAGATAVHCLTATAVGDGDVCLIHAASGGVGLFLVQLAIARGAQVIGTASPANHAALLELGATPVAYGDGLLDRVRALAPDGVDAAIDGVGTDEALDVSMELVADRARIVTIVVSARSRELGVQALGNGPGADPGTEIRNNARLELTTLAGEGRLSIETQGLPLAQAAEAHRAINAGHTYGKIVLVP